MNKIIIFFVTFLVLLSFGWFTQNNQILAQLAPGKDRFGDAIDRYESECGISLLMSPEDYLQQVSQYWNYSFDNMPESLHKQYTCVNLVNIQDNAGVVSSGSEWDGH